MTEFDYDVKERKSLVASARHKKNGSKSRKCPLSTDYMKRKDWEKLNGEVISLNFNQPHSREELRKLPVSLQRDYIKSLLERFNVSTRMLAEMFKCSQRAVYLYIEKIGLQDNFTKNKKRPKDYQRDAWNVLLDGRMPAYEVSNTESELEQEVQEEIKPEAKNERPDCKTLFPIDASLVYNGRLEDVCKALIYALGPDTVGRFHITYDKVVDSDD